MRILYLSQYFPPEIGATQIRAYEMSHGLVDAGHHVTMIAEIPNHPSGIIPPEYRGKFYERTDLHGIDVVRVWVKASPVKTFRHRLLFYLSYMLNATLAALLIARGRYDVLYASSPPLFVGGAALIISYLRRVPLVFEVRDLWPESAVTLGELRNPRFIRWATRLEKACYNRAELVVVTAQEIVDCLIERGIPRGKLALVRNGANVELFKRDCETRRLVRARLGLEDKFLVLYAGLHGLAYDLEGILDVASDLQFEPDIRFLLIGDGPTKERVQQCAYELDLQNVIFLPPQSREQIADFFNAADVSIVPMKEPHIVGTLPIKIYDSMACEVPVIVSAIGEIQLIVENSGAGIATQPRNREQLREAILRLRADPALRAQLGHNGRRAVESCYSRQAQAQQLVQLLQEVVEMAPGDDATPS
jgi:colanic acid biosynthesis glycosyl transferase WcaI